MKITIVNETFGTFHNAYNRIWVKPIRHYFYFVVHRHFVTDNLDDIDIDILGHSAVQHKLRTFLQSTFKTQPQMLSYSKQTEIVHRIPTTQ